MKHTEDDIESLSARTHVRLKPNLYFEKCFKIGTLDIFPFEAACHAIDEFFDKKCSKIEFEINKNFFLLKYNCGMSLKNFDSETTFAESILTKIFVCRNHKKHLKVGEEFCELGIATINFASEKCELETISEGKKGEFKFYKGLLTSKKIDNSNLNEFTQIKMFPDKEIFTNLQFTSEGVKNKFQSLKEKLKYLEMSLVCNI